jgi:DNA invertase Pin-like site-specific DNA recombinase
VRVGLYLRRPTSGEDEFLQSYIASQPGWHIRLHCTDHASGATLQRPGLQRILEAARSGDIDVLVIRHVHKLSRTMRHLALLLDELRSRGVRVVSATNPSSATETAFGSVLVGVLDALADIERQGELEDRVPRRPTQSARASIRRAIATLATSPLMATALSQRTNRLDHVRRLHRAPSVPTHKEVS